jgi:predicted transcriptional regulator
MSTMFQLKVAVKNLDSAPEDFWDRAFIHLVARAKQVSDTFADSETIPKSALTEILQDSSMRFVVEMIAFLTQIRDEGDSDTIPRSLLDCLLQATMPIIANQSQRMVGICKKSALSRVALASEYLGRYLPGYVRGDITLDVGFASNDAAWDQFCHALEEQHLGIYTTTLLD